MGGNTNLRPIVREAFPTNSGSEDAELPDAGGEFRWMENRLRAWEALAVFGGVLLGEGLFWQWPFGGLLATFAVIAVGLCGLPAVYWGYTELAVALFGAVGVMFASIFLSHFALGITQWVTYVGIAGAVLLVLGLAMSVKASRSLSREDRAAIP